MTDLILAGLAVAFILRGLARGAGRPLIETAGIAAAVIAGGATRSAFGDDGGTTGLLAGAVVAAGIALAVIAGSGSLVDDSSPTPVDRFGGMLAGIAETAVLAAGIVLLAGDRPIDGLAGYVVDPLDGIVADSGVLRLFRDTLLPAVGLLPRP